MDMRLDVSHHERAYVHPPLKTILMSMTKAKKTDCTDHSCERAMCALEAIPYLSAFCARILYGKLEDCKY